MSSELSCAIFYLFEISVLQRVLAFLQLLTTRLILIVSGCLCSLAEFASNLVPFPSVKYLTTSFSPIADSATAKRGQVSVSALQLLFLH